MATPPMHKMHYPIETEEAYKFWASRHLCNRLKAIIAFSTDIPDANYNMKRMGYQAHLRLRAINAYGATVASPDMKTIPFSPMSVPWYICIDEVTHKKGHWATWEDIKKWDDKEDWKEWIPDPDPVPPTP